MSEFIDNEPELGSDSDDDDNHREESGADGEETAAQREYERDTDAMAEAEAREEHQQKLAEYERYGAMCYVLCVLCFVFVFCVLCFACVFDSMESICSEIRHSPFSHPLHTPAGTADPEERESEEGEKNRKKQ
jgi:hypothetical protein